MIIRIKDLVKIYQSGDISVPALKGISLEVEKGSFVAIMGPSGSGKSTLMNIIGCLDRPTSGEVEIDGVLTSEMSKSQLAYIRSKKIGFIFQNFNLLPRINALSNVMLPFLYSNFPKSKRKEKALQALKLVNLQDRWKHKPTELSGGERQRVAIARALINDPSIILADEPTGNVDSKAGLEIIALLQKLNSDGLTILMVTHNDYLAQHCERIVHLRDGNIVKDEKVEKQKVASQELKNLLSEGKA